MHSEYDMTPKHTTHKHGVLHH